MVCKVHRLIAQVYLVFEMVLNCNTKVIQLQKRFEARRPALEGSAWILMALLVLAQE